MQNINNSCIAYRVRKLSRLITKIFNRALYPANISIARLNLLNEIKYLPEFDYTKLAIDLQMDYTTLCRNLRYLERNKYLNKSVIKDSRGRPGVKYHLTGKSEAILLKAFPLWEEAQRGIIKVLGSKSLSKGGPLCLEKLKKLALYSN